jgi:Chitobiase/beta-hexosaminidase C-terminal domain
VKTLSALVLLATFTAVSLAQVPPAPGVPPAAQAAQAFAVAQAQSMMITNQAQLQGMIAAQSALLTSVQARSMFLGMAASLQVRAAANQGAMFAADTAAITAMQHSLALQRELQVQSAILSMRIRGIESASAMQGAVQLALLDSVKLSRRTAMLHAAAARAAGQTSVGQTASGQTAAQPSAQAPSPDAASLPAEPPPMMIRPTFGNALVVEKPLFSAASGTVPAGTKISIRSETHYATLYYTTNGWTPTTQSAKYTGPITINSNAHLEVIAVGPNFLRSSVERADYQVANSPAPVLESTVLVSEDGILRAGTPVRVAFAGGEVDSDLAAVGDEIAVVLDEQVKLGETVLAPKGTPVNAALTFADPSRGSAPGDLVFEIHSVEVAGKRVPLFGGETLEGGKGVLGGGKGAKIKPGMTAMAFVAADTLVK